MFSSIPSNRQLSKFFIPLALQAMSQSFTYPLVSMVAMRGEGGASDFAGLAQGSLVLWLISTMGSGLVPTGMVYGKTREGYSKFLSAKSIIICMFCIVYAICCIPVFSHVIFGVLIGLPKPIEATASSTFLYRLPLFLLFFLRIPYQVALFNARATGRAFAATMGRILLTLILSPIFCVSGAVGPGWAVVCLTIPVALEVIVSRYFAIPFIRNLPSGAGSHVKTRELLAFSFPFSIGGFFLALSGSMVGAFVARAPEPERMLPVYYLAMGLASPVAFGATHIRTVVLSFSGSDQRNRKILRFAVFAGVIMGILPLVFILPLANHWYYVVVQRLPASNLHLVRNTALALVFYPLSVAMRAYSEGRAAFIKKPVTVLAGQATYLGLVTTVSFFALNLGTAGNMIGPIAILVGNLSATGVVMLSVYLEQKKDVILPPTKLSTAR